MTAEMVAGMNKDAILFAMANPVPEIMPDVAKAAGARVVGTGRSDFPNQVNNVVVFPGIFKGALESRATKITDEMKLIAANAVAGLVAEEDLSEPLSASIKKRMPWLLVLLVLGMCVSSVVGLFEKVISQLTIIMAFQSLILDMAGNVGTQSLAVTIRVLTDENITFKEKLSLVAKEMKIGFSGGVILGVISILFVGLYLMVFKAKTAAFAFAVSACIGAALLLSMVISSAVGTLIPLFFKKIKIDPAVASGPLITTINDLVAVVTYYGLSWILLINIMNLTG